MPTPWPKPAPRITNREAAEAGAGTAAGHSRAQTSGRRRRAIGEAGRAGPVVSLGGHTAGGGVAGMSQRQASEPFVGGPEAEGVEYVFGIPGEETLDLNESLERSAIDFVPVRH